MRITVTESLFIARSPEDVWDYTQDYAARSEWERSILEAHVSDAGPLPSVRVRIAGGTSGVFRYKLFDRPRRTSVVLSDVESALITVGGGSWSYEARDGGTLWTQTNSIEVRAVAVLLAPLVRWNLRGATRRAMRRAKRALETAEINLG